MSSFYTRTLRLRKRPKGRQDAGTPFFVVPNTYWGVETGFAAGSGAPTTTTDVALRWSCLEMTWVNMDTVDHQLWFWLLHAGEALNTSGSWSALQDSGIGREFLWNGVTIPAGGAVHEYFNPALPLEWGDQFIAIGSDQDPVASVVGDGPAIGTAPTLSWTGVFVLDPIVIQAGRYGPQP
jgi:hypothetical protein